MYARSTSVALGIVLLLLPVLASAKASNFGNRSDFGIGVDGIYESKPSSDFATSPQSLSASSSHAFGIQPFGDFGNYVIKGDFSLHYAPDVSGSGTDATGKFSESSVASIWSAGIVLQLIPYVAKSQRERIFIKFGGGEAQAKLTNTRNYTGATYVEKDNASTEYYLLGAGYEFYFFQNYSLELGGGYQSMNFGKFSYKSGTQVDGSTLNAGTNVIKSNGQNKDFDLSGIYFNIALNLHF